MMDPNVPVLISLRFGSGIVMEPAGSGFRITI